MRTGSCTAAPQENYFLIDISSPQVSMPKKIEKDQGPVTTDPRFSVIHTDPRFARPKRKDVKIPLDSRFKAAFKDKEFVDQRTMFEYCADHSER
jgi:hypothetical protein